MVQAVFAVVGLFVVLTPVALGSRLRARLRSLERRVLSLERGVTAAEVAKRIERRGEPSPAPFSTPAVDEVLRESGDSMAMDASTTGDVDDRVTSVYELPPTYAARLSPMRPPAPGVFPGPRDIEEDPEPHLESDEKTPPRRGRATMVVPVYTGPTDGSAA